MKNIIHTTLLLILIVPGSLAGIVINPSLTTSDIAIDTIVVSDIEYHMIRAEGFDSYPDIEAVGTPCLPFRSHCFLLPPQMQIDGIEIIASAWDTLPGKYYIYPTQNASMEDTTFEYPDSLIYSSSNPWPANPIEISGQSGMMGVGIATVFASPVRYIPSDSLLLIVSSMQISVDIGSKQFVVLSPQRETEWSAESRYNGILSLVDNPSDYRMYSRPQVCRDSGESGPLTITEIPSANGDGVDFVIITNAELADDWQDLADLRTKQGIITVVKTVEWIETEYSGCDIQEQMKNFIADAYEFWGTSMILLGGDDDIVPVRLCTELNTYPSQGYPCDDYYVDVDDVSEWWDPLQGNWKPPYYYLNDLCVGRVPVDNSSMVQAFLSKLDLYEDPLSLPSNFARNALFMGDSDNTTSTGGNYTAADDFETFNQDLHDDGIAGTGGKYLDVITELYWPQHDPLERWSSPVELSQYSALSELSDGYNIVFHCSHSGAHQMGAQAAEGLTIRQYITENDVLNMSNEGEPGILMSLGCWPAHFEGAECIAERALLNSDDSGFIGILACARSGHWPNVGVYFGSFTEALYYYCPSSGGGGQEIGPSKYLGECYRYIVNGTTNSDRYHLNLLGDPTMFIWRGDPTRPTVTPNPSTVTAGTFSTSIFVSEDDIGIPNAKVILYKENELFAIGKTNSLGIAAFSNIQVATSGSIEVTVIKRKEANDIEHYLPASSSITVQQNSQALVVLNDLPIDDDESGGSHGNDDGEVNPGETIQFDLVVENTGLQTARNTVATLSILSGSEYIEQQIDMMENLGNIPAQTEAVYNQAFSIEIKDNISFDTDPVMMQVTLSHASGTRRDPTDFRIHLSELELPVYTMTISQSSGVQITIDDMYFVNAGLGGAEDVEIEFTNWSGNITFTGDLVESIGDIEGCSGSEVLDGITATCANPSGHWNPITRDASFDLEISHRWGSLDPITIHPYEILQQLPDLDPPEDIEVLNAGQDFVSLEWSTTDVEENGWYLWKRIPPASWERSNLEPIHGELRHGTIDELQAGTTYDLGVTVIGKIGQESEIGSISTSTTLPLLNDNWPVTLDGGIGSAPAIADIDNDGDNEVITATFSGSVFIVEENGSATKIFDSDYHLSGIAIGQVHPSSTRDEIVVSGWNFDPEDIYSVVIVLKWDPLGGWTSTEIEASYGGSQRTHDDLTVPVLLNADNNGDLEIALRTFNGDFNASNSWLYIWTYAQDEWSAMSGFPRILTDGAYEYAAPIVIGDTDGDQYPELLISAGEEILLWIEPGTQQSDNKWDLSGEGILPSGAWDFGYAYLVAIPEQSETRVIGIATNSNGHAITYCVSTTNGGSTPGYSLEWKSPGMIPLVETYGNIGGYAVGDVDGDGYLEVVKQWDRSSTSLPDYVVFREISNGDSLTLEDIPYNFHQEDPSLSSVVIAGDAGDGLASLYAMSTIGQAVIIDSGEPEREPGFPLWTEDRISAAPTIGNLDSDAYLEVLFADRSGRLIALDWDVPASGSDDWPMLQHDLHRTGNFGYSADGDVNSTLDLRVVETRIIGSNPDIEYSVTSSLIEAVFAISGAETEEPVSFRIPAVTSDLVTESRDEVATERELSSSDRTFVEVEDAESTQSVSIALYTGNHLHLIKRIPLRNGEHTAMFEMSDRSMLENCFIVIDPFQEYYEVDEDNNAQEVASNPGISLEIEEFRVTSEDGIVAVSILPGSAVSGDMEINLYSLDGRLISGVREEHISSLNSEIRLQGEDGPLPSGCYILTVEGGNDLSINRKVLVLR